MPKFKPIIKQDFRIQFKEEGGSSWSAKSLKEAEEKAKRISKELKEKWEEINSDEAIRKKRLEFIEYNLQSYINLLKKELWHETRGARNEEDKKLVEQKKKIREVLLGIYLMKTKIVWHQGFDYNDTTSYSIEKVGEK